MLPFHISWAHKAYCMYCNSMFHGPSLTNYARLGYSNKAEVSVSTIFLQITSQNNRTILLQKLQLSHFFFWNDFELLAWLSQAAMLDAGKLPINTQRLSYLPQICRAYKWRHIESLITSILMLAIFVSSRELGKYYSDINIYSHAL